MYLDFGVGKTVRNDKTEYISSRSRRSVVETSGYSIQNKVSRDSRKLHTLLHDLSLLSANTYLLFTFFMDLKLNFSNYHYLLSYLRKKPFFYSSTIHTVSSYFNEHFVLGDLSNFLQCLLSYLKSF